MLPLCRRRRKSRARVSLPGRMVVSVVESLGMQSSTYAIIRNALANDSTVSSEHFACIVQTLEEPPYLPRLTPRPLLTLDRLARDVGQSRWTIRRILDEFGEENLPPDCRPSTPRARKMYPRQLAEWLKNRRELKTTEPRSGLKLDAPTLPLRVLSAL